MPPQPRPIAQPGPRPGACRLLYANQLVIDQRWAFRLCDPFWRLYFNRDAGASVADGRRRWELTPYRAVLVPAWGEAAVIGDMLRATLEGFYNYYYRV